jgi:hypothetical protein
MFTDKELNVIYDILDFQKNYIDNDVDLEETIRNILDKIHEDVSVK